MTSNQYSGKANFIENGWFKDSAEGIVLVGGRCENCGKIFFPKKTVCPNCFDGELKDIPLSKRGKLHTYSLSVMGPPEIEKPYVCAFIDLPEGIKLFSVLTDCEPWDEVLQIGMDMEMIVEKIKEDKSGNEILSYKFRPINTETKR